ncbi:MAG: hypothetical protein SO019_07195, partial [Lachnospiraceae bacterium]|nr:hypothetical protein [Lachnospiraceae bacterium]
MEKMKKVLQKQKGVGKHSRRIACLLLALVLTITGLPMMGGVEEAKAESITFGKHSYGRYNTVNKSLNVVTSYYSTGEIEADSSYDKVNYDSIKADVVILEIGEKITSLKGFDGMSSLQTVIFNSEPQLDSNFLKEASNELTIQLPINCTPDFKSRLSDHFNQLQLHGIQYEESHLIKIIDAQTCPQGFVVVTNNMYKKQYSTS